MISLWLRVLDKPEVESVYLRYRDLGMERILLMTKDFVENKLAYYKIDIASYDPILSYNFYLRIDGHLYFYSQDQLTDHLIDDEDNFKILVDYPHVDWMRQSVFYQIMPDRFYHHRPQGESFVGSYTYQGYQPRQMAWDEVPLDYKDAHCMDFYGGDLYGIIDKLDYLQDLGVTALYLNPIFTSPTIHKYDALDYFEIDPFLGGNKALADLREALNQRKMKLILDISINHTSSEAKWFNKEGSFYPLDQGAYNNVDSPFRSFYFFTSDKDYLSWFNVKTMPSLNYGSLALRKMIYKDPDSVLKKWLLPPYSIDGWRFDVADVMARNSTLDVYHEVWKEIHDEVKSVNKEAVILAEEWHHTPDMYQGDQWDSTMNYFMSSRLLRGFAGELDVLVKRVDALSDLKPNLTSSMIKDSYLRAKRKIAGQIQGQLLNLINSHDTTRLYNDPEVSYEANLGAMVILFGLPGAVSLYYGDEILLEGRMQVNEGARYPMNWNKPLRDDQEKMKEAVRTLAHLKNSQSALSYGGFKFLESNDQVLALVRFTKTEAFVFAWSQVPTTSQLVLDRLSLGLGDQCQSKRKMS